jgi:hypothetical protein
VGVFFVEKCCAGKNDAFCEIVFEKWEKFGRKICDSFKN